VAVQAEVVERKKAALILSTDRKTRQLQKITDTCQEHKVYKTVNNLRGPLQRLFIDKKKDQSLFDALKSYIKDHDHNLGIEGFNIYLEESINLYLSSDTPIVKKINPSSSRGRAIQELFTTLNLERLKRQALPTQIQKAQQGKKQCRQVTIENYLENLRGPLERLFKIKDTSLMSLLVEFCEYYENPQQQKPTSWKSLNIAAFNEFLEAKHKKKLTPGTLRYETVGELLRSLSTDMYTYRIYK
jgi:hypothetical protein